MQVSAANQLDILFVEDTSHSMHENRYVIGKKLKNFATILKGIDWQIGVSTTSIGKNALNGALVKARSGESILKPTTSRLSNKFDEIISLLMCNDTESWNWLQPPCTLGEEKPLYASILSLQNPQARPLFRDRVNTAIVYLTDEDEAALDKTGDRANARDVMAAFAQVWGSSKTLRAFGIMIRPNDHACLNEETQPLADPGAQYAFAVDELVRATAGSSTSLCNGNYDQVLSEIARHAGPNPLLKRELTLQTNPIPGSVKVMINSTQSVNWTISGRRILFAQPPMSGATIRISYQHY